MRIVIAAPLYPPDITPSASYTKELARRLSDRHEVIVVTYGEVPEKLTNVRTRTVTRAQPLVVRLIAFYHALLVEAVHADCVIIENGSSVELPAFFALLGTRCPVIFDISDTGAHERARGVRGLIERTVKMKARVIREHPHPQPEILPFVAYPKEAFEVYERSWQTHMQQLTVAFSHE